MHVPAAASQLLRARPAPPPVAWAIPETASLSGAAEPRPEERCADGAAYRKPFMAPRSPDFNRRYRRRLRSCPRVFRPEVSHVFDRGRYIF